MHPVGPSSWRRVVVASLVGMLLGAIAVFCFLASRTTPKPGTMVPFASIYHDPLSKLDVMLTGGDGHAFAVIAEDPTLSRPTVLREPQEFAYRAQRPVWGYLTWAVSLGRARYVGWVLVALTILSCGTACAVTSVFLLQRRRSPWWCLLVPFVAFETLTEATPELFSLALVGVGVLLWQRERRGWAVVALSVAALTRETMLLAVGALALWAFTYATASLVARARRVLPLAIPFAAYLAWISFLRVHLGDWPFNRSGDRLSAPGVGLADALRHGSDPRFVEFWVVVGLAVCVAALVLARADVLTWIAVAFAAFATLLGPDVWLTNAGFQRALLPPFVFAPVAVLGGLRAREAVGSGEAEHRGQEPAGVAVGGLGDLLG